VYELLTSSINATWPAHLLLDFINPSNSSKGKNYEAIFSGLFLSAFAKLRKATISFVMVVCLSIRPFVRMEQLVSHWMDFHEIWYLKIYRKYFEKIQVSLTSDKNNKYVVRRPIHVFIISRSILFYNGKFLDKKTNFNFNNFFFLNPAFYEIM
jgi:hypothetical protein